MSLLDDITPSQGDSMGRHSTKASEIQIAGNHYKKFAIQPAEFCHINKIPYLEASAIKYLCRWRDKGGFEDLEKAKHFIDLIMEYENAHK